MKKPTNLFVSNVVPMSLRCRCDDVPVTSFKQAAQASLDERWLPMSKAKSIKKMEKIFANSKCALCIFIGDCKNCMLHDVGMDCCKEYSKWDIEDYKNNFKKAHKAARALVKRLKKIAKGE